jgi:hypothetical protein
VLERWLLIEFLAVAQTVGTDEPLNISVRMAANMCNVQKSSAAEAMAELEVRGFLVRVWRGERRRGTASAWRITCLPFQGESPTCDYLRKPVDRSEPFFTPELEAHLANRGARTTVVLASEEGNSPETARGDDEPLH